MTNIRLRSSWTLLILLAVARAQERAAHFVLIEDLERYYDLEGILMSSVESYIEEQEELLNLMKVRSSSLTPGPEVDATLYTRNPLNNLGLMRRLLYHWPVNRALYGKPTPKGALLSRENYEALVTSLSRLQQDDSVSTASLKAGNSPTLPPSASLEGVDY